MEAYRQTSLIGKGEFRSLERAGLAEVIVVLGLKGRGRAAIRIHDKPGCLVLIAAISQHPMGGLLYAMAVNTFNAHQLGAGRADGLAQARSCTCAPVSHIDILTAWKLRSYGCIHCASAYIALGAVVQEIVQTGRIYGSAEISKDHRRI